jgi:hypothetical protein
MALNTSFAAEEDFRCAAAFYDGNDPTECINRFVADSTRLSQAQRKIAEWGKFQFDVQAQRYVGFLQPERFQMPQALRRAG